MRNKLVIAAGVFLTVSLAVTAAVSLKWRMFHDSPILLYYAFLIDRLNFVPYRDLYDMNMPGTHLFNVAVVKLFGYGDIGFRMADLCYLGLVSAVNLAWMKRFGWIPAWFGTVIFGLVYLAGGPMASMEREYIIILPVMLAVLVSSSFPALNGSLRALAVGILFGMAGLVKPHSVIAFPAVIFFMLWDIKKNDSGPSRPLSIIAAAISGFAVPLIIAGAYLLKNEALYNFLDTAKNYWPLYAGINNRLVTISGWNKTTYLLSAYMWFTLHSAWLVPSAVGIYFSIRGSRLEASGKRRVALLAALAICYSIYPLLSGQNFDYHWLLFQYFMVQASSLCLVEYPYQGRRLARFIPAILLLAVSLSPVISFASNESGYTKSRRLKRADEIASYLKSNMREGDRVQPLDWTGGTIHAMLIAKARPATGVLCDFQFYHNVSDPYIRGLRKKFIESLAVARPRFVVQVVSEDKPWVKGADTTTRFPELESFLYDNYRIVSRGDGYFIYELSRGRTEL